MGKTKDYVEIDDDDEEPAHESTSRGAEQQLSIKGEGKKQSVFIGAKLTIKGTAPKMPKGKPFNRSDVAPDEKGQSGTRSSKSTLLNGGYTSGYTTGPSGFSAPAAPSGKVARRGDAHPGFLPQQQQKQRKEDPPAIAPKTLPASISFKKQRGDHGNAEPAAQEGSNSTTLAAPFTRRISTSSTANPRMSGEPVASHYFKDNKKGKGKAVEPVEVDSEEDAEGSDDDPIDDPDAEADELDIIGKRAPPRKRQGTPHHNIPPGNTQLLKERIEPRAHESTASTAGRPSRAARGGTAIILEDDDDVEVGPSRSRQQQQQQQGNRKKDTSGPSTGRSYPEGEGNPDKDWGAGVKPAPKAAPKPVMEMKSPHTISIDLINIGCPDTCGYVECDGPDAHLFYIVPNSNTFRFAIVNADYSSTKQLEIAPVHFLELSLPSSIDDKDRWIIATVDARDKAVQALARSFTIKLLPVPQEGDLEVAFRISRSEMAIWQPTRRPEITKFCSVVKAMGPRADWTTFTSPLHSSGRDQAFSREYDEHYNRRGAGEAQHPQQLGSSSSVKPNSKRTSMNGPSGDKPKQERLARRTSGPQGQPALSEQAIDSFFERPVASASTASSGHKTRQAASASERDKNLGAASTGHNTRQSGSRAKRQPVDIDPTSAEKIVLIWPGSGVPGSVAITHGDTKRLDDGEFLNDTLIEYGLKKSYATVRDAAPTNILMINVASRTHLYNSFFYKKISVKRRKDVDWYGTVRKWTNKVDIFSKDFLIVPINEHMHWYLAIVVNPAALLRAQKDYEARQARKAEEAAAAAAPQVLTRTSAAAINIDEDEPEPEPEQVEILAQPQADIDQDEDESSPEDEELQRELEDSKMGEDEGKARRVLGVFGAAALSDSRAPSTTADGSDDEAFEEDKLERDKQSKQAEDAQMDGVDELEVPAAEGAGEALAEGAMAELAAPVSAPVEERSLLEGCVDNKKCQVFLFDSLGGDHSVVHKKIRDYLVEEAKDKNKGIIEPKVAEKFVVTYKAEVPQQGNYCDCGLYLLHYVETFLADPIQALDVIQHSDSVSAFWKEDEAKDKRKVMREEVLDKSKEWTKENGPRLEAKEKKKRDDKAAKEKEKAEKEQEQKRAAEGALQEARRSGRLGNMAVGQDANVVVPAKRKAPKSPKGKGKGKGKGKEPEGPIVLSSDDDTDEDEDGNDTADASEGSEKAVANHLLAPSSSGQQAQQQARRSSSKTPAAPEALSSNGRDTKNPIDENSLKTIVTQSSAIVTQPDGSRKRPFVQAKSRSNSREAAEPAADGSAMELEKLPPAEASKPPSAASSAAVPVPLSGTAANPPQEAVMSMPLPQVKAGSMLKAAAKKEKDKEKLKNGSSDSKELPGKKPRSRKSSEEGSDKLLQPAAVASSSKRKSKPEEDEEVTIVGSSSETVIPESSDENAPALLPPTKRFKTTAAPPPIPQPTQELAHVAGVVAVVAPAVHAAVDHAALPILEPSLAVSSSSKTQEKSRAITPIDGAEFEPFVVEGGVTAKGKGKAVGDDAMEGVEYIGSKGPVLATEKANAGQSGKAKRSRVQSQDGDAAETAPATKTLRPHPARDRAKDTPAPTPAASRSSPRQAAKHAAAATSAPAAPRQITPGRTIQQDDEVDELDQVDDSQSQESTATLRLDDPVAAAADAGAGSLEVAHGSPLEIQDVLMTEAAPAEAEGDELLAFPGEPPAGFSAPATQSPPQAPAPSLPLPPSSSTSTALPESSAVMPPSAQVHAEASPQQKPRSKEKAKTKANEVIDLTKESQD